MYERLRQHLHQHPLGFPRTSSGRELNLLSRLFTEEEIAVALQLTPRAHTAEEVGERLGEDRDRVVELLRRMADKGLILQEWRKGEERYRLLPFMPGIYELQVKAIDEAMAQEFEQIYPELARELFGATTPWARVIPVEKSLPAEIEVLPYEKVSQIVEQADKIALADCICRKQKKLAGGGCYQPQDEICLYFSIWAEFGVAKGLSREVTKEEALKALSRGQKAGLVHTVMNVQWQTTFICQCCSCCCGLLRGLVEFHLPAAVAKSRYFSVVAAELCIGCEACIPICPPKAMSLQEDKAVADTTTCFGCGLCVAVCPTEAIRLQPRAGEEHPLPPGSFQELMQTIAREKGRTYFYR
jgi:ferredoxin/predicted transcriptional regulator